MAVNVHNLCLHVILQCVRLLLKSDVYIAMNIMATGQLISYVRCS